MQSYQLAVCATLGLVLTACLQASKVEPGADPSRPRLVEPVPATPVAAPAEPHRDELKSMPETHEAERAERLAAGAPAPREAAKIAAPASMGLMAAPQQAFNTENYRYLPQNDFLRPTEKPLSTFSADVDTASYANVRRFVQDGNLPPQDAVRIEELVNYFPYQYPEPKQGEPFGVRLDMAEAPWNPEHRLVRIGIQSKSIDWSERKPSNLVFLLDVSGSMNDPKKLPLVIESMQMLTEQMDARDRIAIVVYAGASGLVLPPTAGDRRAVIVEALSRLCAGGSTNGGAGIELAYQMAKENFIAGGLNRVILATDGDFNVGTTGEGDLVRLVQDNAKSGVFLTVLGFGMGNYKDAMLELLADKGNGNYAYIDSRHEARKVFVDQLGGTLQTVAKDVKFQVEFNPAAVAAYRLLGYENRLLQDHEFNDDTVDAGDVGAGHAVTALYEIVPAGAGSVAPRVDALKYQAAAVPNGAGRGEALTLKIRYKEPDGNSSRLLTYSLRDEHQRLAAVDDDFRFAAAVAAWGMVLRASPHKGQATHAMVLALAKGAVGADPHGYRTEFLTLVHKSGGL